MRPSDAGPVAPERPRRLRKDSGTFDIGIFLKPPWPDVKNRKRDRLQHGSARPKCPRCGSEVVLRRGKTGAHAGKEFWGCSMFFKTKCGDPALNATNEGTMILWIK